jgi:methylmalonyl-CoA/ethylmalonyl-CoA epimerase
MSEPSRLELPDLPGGPLVVSTVGMAVADLRASMKRYWETLGWGPWKVYRQEPPGLRAMRLAGQPSRFSFLVAGTSMPGMPAYWLCQPLEGPSLYRQLVEEGGAGPHFMTVWRQSEVDSLALRRWFAARGAGELMSARVGDALEFCFLDTRRLLGTILETGSGRSIDQPLDAVYP